ncbi:response regulator [candidate division KSB1 bacterium]|nr:response regulator [candidate division KSB1 bacterium]
MSTKILVCEDEKISHEAVARVVKSLGHEVLSAWTGAESIQMCTEHRPDLVLLDMLFSDTDGVSVLKQMRSNPDTRSIPVICMSASSPESTRQRLGAMSVSGIIAKPVRPGELKELMDQLLNKQEETKAGDHLVLCIDESAVQRKVFERLLTEMGMRTVFATTITEARVLLQNVLPHVILFDVKQNYREVLDLARKRGANLRREIPIIAVMSAIDHKRLQVLYQNGVTDILLKPIASGRLQHAVEQALVKDQQKSKDLSAIKTVMVIEDFTITAKSLEALLKRAGYKPLMARTAELALGMIASQVPDLILLDYNLPGMNGDEFIAQLRKQDLDVPFAVITSSREPSIVYQFRKLGAIKVLNKPIDPEMLESLIQSHFASGAAGAEGESSVQVLLVMQDAAGAEILGDVLMKNSITHRPINNVHQAWAELEHRPRVVVIDSMLDSMEGIDFVRRIRESFKSSVIRIVALQEMNSAASKRDLFEAGADELVSKPVDLPRFVDTVKQCLAPSTAGVTIEEFCSAFSTEIGGIPGSGDPNFRAHVKRLGHNLAGSAGLIDQAELEELGRGLETQADQETIEKLQASITAVQRLLAELAPAGGPAKRD